MIGYMINIDFDISGQSSMVKPEAIYWKPSFSKVIILVGSSNDNFHIIQATDFEGSINKLKIALASLTDKNVPDAIIKGLKKLGLLRKILFLEKRHNSRSKGQFWLCCRTTSTRA